MRATGIFGKGIEDKRVGNLADHPQVLDRQILNALHSVADLTPGTDEDFLGPLADDR